MTESRSYHLKYRLCAGLGMGLAVLGLLCLAGLIVSLLLLGLKDTGLSLYAILCGSFAGGAALTGGLGACFMRAGERFAAKERDALERADSEESFFVGEGTLARFGKESFIIRSEKGRQVAVPYAETAFYSVCTRTSPKEKGEWSVLLEFPARLLDPKSGENAPPVLIQTDGKERLYACLQAHALTLRGELPPQQKVHKKFTRLKKFGIAVPKKRKRALVFALLGAAALCGGVGLAFYQLTIGGIVAFLGGYVLLRGGLALRRARRTLAVYEEGLFLGEPNARESCFLKWEELSRLRITEGEEGTVLRAECPYGAYEFPCPAEACAFLRERFAEKFGATDAAQA